MQERYDIVYRMARNSVDLLFKMSFVVEVFCIVTPYNFVIRYQSFRGICCLIFRDGGSMGL
jgi:hypothetical protein